MNDESRTCNIDWTIASESEIGTIYHALRAYLYSPESNGEFHNADKGHPFYIPDPSGGTTPSAFPNADGPDKNSLYQIGHAVYVERQRRIDANEDCIDPEEGKPTPFASWHDFVTAAAQSYNANNQDI